MTRRKIGSKWYGKKFEHGPRITNPKRYSEFRLGKPGKNGVRQVFGKVKGTNKWERQSVLKPTKTIRKRRRDGVVQRYRVKK